MSKKIYAVIGLLIVLSIGIMGMAVYSIFTLSNVAGNLVALGNRASALNGIDKLILERTITTREVNLAKTAEEVAELMQGRMAENEHAMQPLLQLYDNNLAANSDPDQVMVSKRLGDMWGEFVRESKVVGDFALENTNNRAEQLNNQNVAFWEEVDEDMTRLAAVLFQENTPASIADARRVDDMKSDLLRFRLILVKYIFESDPAVAAGYKATIMDIISRVDQTTNDLAASLPPAKGGNLAKALMDEKLSVTGKELVGQIITLVDRNSNVLANTHMVGPTRDARKRVEAVTGEYLERIATAQANARTQTAAIERQSLILMIVVSVVGIVVAAILAWRIISNVVSRLNHIITGLGNSSERVFGSSGQISDAAQSLAEGATEQAASLEQTSSALEQMASMTRQNADNASKTSQTMDSTLKLVETGSDTVKNVTSAMAEISESAEKIGNIIKTIEEIAFQTNLLALNAAVEAARAGEAGKGFAVVADEVRNLAQRSAQAAKDTSELIRSTVERVQNGSENVARLAEGFTGIDEASQNVGKLVTQISSATSEQAQGVDQVNTAVAQMDKVTQTNAANAEQSASAASEMSEQANQLKSMVDQLIELVEGSGHVVTVDPSSISDSNGNGDGNGYHDDDFSTAGMRADGKRFELTMSR